MDYTLRTLWVNRKQQDRKEWENLLSQESLFVEGNLDEVIGIYIDSKLVATGARQQNILKCLAVSKEHKGGVLFNKLVTEIMKRIANEGYSSYYAYTKPDSVKSFLFLGFKEIICTADVVFLEKSIEGIDNYLTTLLQARVKADTISSIVMNANPFTKGHLFLIEKAASENDIVHLFVVSEDRSFFPVKIREKLVREGTAHLKNVYIHPTENYIVSTQTFPSYFLSEDTEVTRVQARLDAMLFKNRIAPTLGITSRYVGEEPYSLATSIYNKAMQEIFGKDIRLIELPRKTLDTSIKDDYISATKVRKLLSSNEIEKVEPYVPQTTYRFLQSERGAQVISKGIKEFD